jgi:GTPase SAR1 family protein
MLIKKILMLGEIGVGKTSISRRLAFDTFGDVYKATIGVDIFRYELDPPPDGIPFQFLVWDTDGSFGEAIFRQVYARHADAAMIVADVSRPATIEAMIELGRQFSDIQPGRYFAHIVNKTDLVNDEVPADIARRLEALKVPWLDTSAASGRHVRDAFHVAARDIMKLDRARP